MALLYWRATVVLGFELTISCINVLFVLLVFISLPCLLVSDPTDKYVKPLSKEQNGSGDSGTAMNDEYRLPLWLLIYTCRAI